METLLLGRVQDGAGVQELRGLPVLDGRVGVLLQAGMGEHDVDVLDEGEVVDLGRVFLESVDTLQSLELVLLQVDLHEREDAPELVKRDSALAQGVEVTEVLFDSDVVHLDLGLEPVEQDGLIDQRHLNGPDAGLSLTKAFLFGLSLHDLLVQDLFA